MRRVSEILPIVIQVVRKIGIRKLAFMLFVTVSMVSYARQRRVCRRQEDDEIKLEELYDKNEEGLYPWEADTDDSPERIPQNAQRYVNTHGPKRGRW